MKTCTRCKKEKDLSEFYKDKTRPDGYKSACKWCEGKFIPSEARCIKCGKWFIKKLKNNKFCCGKCRIKHYKHIYNLSIKHIIVYRKYMEKNREKLSAKSKEWYWLNRERVLQRIKLRQQRRRLAKNKFDSGCLHQQDYGKNFPRPRRESLPA